MAQIKPDLANLVDLDHTSLKSTRLRSQAAYRKQRYDHVGVKPEPMDTNNLLNQLLMIGIGTTSLMADKLRELSDQWVRDGKLNPDQAKTLMDELTQQFKNDTGTLEAQFQRQVKNLLQDLGVPRQNEMDELRGRIDRLERQIRDLENRSWR